MGAYPTGVAVCENQVIAVTFSSKHLCFFGLQPGLKLLACYLLKNAPIRVWAVHKVVLVTDKENTLHVFYWEKMLKQDVIKVMKDEETLAFSLWKKKMIKPAQSLMGHTDQVTQVTVMEGQGGGNALFASASFDATVLIWDYASLTIYAKVVSVAAIRDIAYHANATTNTKTLLLAGSQPECYIYPLTQLSQGGVATHSGVLRGHVSSLISVNFLPHTGGTKCVTADDIGFIRFWDLQKGGEAFQLLRPEQIGNFKFTLMAPVPAVDCLMIAG